MTPIVLFGGPSDERHVSVASAQAIVRALGDVGTGFSPSHRGLKPAATSELPLAWFWSPEGAIHDVALDDLLAHENPFTADYLPSRPAIFPTIEQAVETMPVEEPVMVLALHGTGGEDGPLQELLERQGIPFTGSGSKASAAAFDKNRAKVLVAAKVKTPEARVANDAREIGQIIADMFSRHEKIVLKPLAGGSSRGLYFLARGQRFDTTPQIPYIVEQFVAGRELTVGVIDEGNGPFALPVLEIEVDADRTFDYEGKYLGHGTREICPAHIPADIAGEAQEAAVAAHVALGCEGYSRTDFVAADDGMYYLETNTLPGLTKSSLVPQQLAAAAIPFRDFLEKQIELAVRRTLSST